MTEFQELIAPGYLSELP